MNHLVIVESPSKSKTIEKYLGNNFKVTSSKGHICDLAIKGKDGLGIDVDDHFKTTYTINKDKKETIKELKKMVKEADQVYLATDPDREGEAISWHLARELGLDEQTTPRVEFHEITKHAVQEAFGHPRTIDMDLVRSQETRRMLDRIIGFKLSKLLNNKIKSKSAGRVQSVALKLIVDREDEIKAFVPEEYWTIHANFELDGMSFVADLAKYQGEKITIASKEDADRVIFESENPFVVSQVKKQVKSKGPKAPFITSTLQQEASTKLGFSAKKTMQIAQKLYEGINIKGDLTGLITYMRTDSTRLSDVFMAQAKEMIKERYGKEYVGYYRIKKNEGAQDAHEAIRPTHIEYRPEEIKDSLTNDEYKLYSFIYYRAIAALMSDAKNNTVTLTLSSCGYDYVANGKEMIFDGYLKAYAPYESNKNEILPELKENQMMEAKLVDGKQHFTEPPLRYSEARLIKGLEEFGIGRPSTYAMIIDTIQARGYVTLERPSDGSKTKVFIPTEQGELTCRKLDEYFSSIINVMYTAKMEHELDEIADGKLDNIQLLQKFWDKFIPLVDHAYANMEKKEPEKVGELCPDCGKELVIRQGRYGKFISCSGYPECKYTRKIEKPAEEQPELTDQVCPECGAFLLRRKSRYGTYFFGCSNFPKCKYLKSDENSPKKFIPRRKKRA
ncbi:MAG: type I DNA topoisomerase [Erysipelotrichaceae bacterium]|nr:type I DNA topoisomerase [Erysipelotrichaceae bacterium]